MKSLLSIILLHFFLRLLAAQDLCDRYGGGWLVWPEDKTRTVEHAVHWSKAQSKINSSVVVVLDPYTE